MLGMQWFPVVFDGLTIIFFAAGCLLLWLNLRPAKEIILTAAAQIEDQDLDARRPSELEPHEPGKLGAQYAADFQPLSDEPPDADAGIRPSTPIDQNGMDQNSYAGRVALAMTKSRMASARL
jgi:hypothetical protein